MRRAIGIGILIWVAFCFGIAAVTQINLTTQVSGILPAANGGTGNAYFTVSGPGTPAKTYTFPNANATIEYQANKNVASGYAGLDANSRLAAAQFPALTGSVTTPGGSLATTLAALSTVTGALASDVTMTTAGTFYDGPTNALTAAKWSLGGTVTLQTTSVATAVQFVCKLWDGTTVVASSESVQGAVASAAVRNSSITLSGIVTPTGAATWKISCTSNTASQLIKAATPQYGAGNNASTLNSVKLQ